PRSVVGADQGAGSAVHRTPRDRPDLYSDVAGRPAGAATVEVGGGRAQLAFGTYVSPDYETAAKVIPPVGTRTGVPAVQSQQEIYFNLILPAGSPPPQGWPVAIFGPGSGGNKVGSAPFILAAELAAHGIATI